MADWVDFREVRERVSLETVLFVYYELTSLKREGQKAIGPCPVHGGDSPRAFHADLEKNVWHCFSQCQHGGNQLDFVAKKEGISIREAALKLKARFIDGQEVAPATSVPTARAGNTTPPSSAATPGKGNAKPPATTPAGSTASAPTTPRPGRPPHGGAPAAGGSDGTERPANPVLTFELGLKAEHPHLTKDRGLSLATLQHFGVGYCSRGIMRGTIAIPIHNAEGERVAYAGRRLRPSDIEEHGKYVFPKGFKKDLELFNYHRAQPSMTTDGLILVEGFFSVMKLFEAGFENVAAVMGSHLSEAQAALAVQAPHVTIMFDGNAAGRAGAAAAAELLAGRTVVRLVELPDDYEPENLSPRALRWLLNGLRLLDLAAVRLTPRT